MRCLDEIVSARVTTINVIARSLNALPEAMSKLESQLGNRWASSSNILFPDATLQLLREVDVNLKAWQTSLDEREEERRRSARRLSDVELKQRLLMETVNADLRAYRRSVTNNVTITNSSTFSKHFFNNLLVLSDTDTNELDNNQIEEFNANDPDDLEALEDFLND